MSKLSDLLNQINAKPVITCTRHNTTLDCNGCEYDVKGNCDITRRKADYLLKHGIYAPTYDLYDSVYIIDIYDIDNDCSQISDGSGSKNREYRVRECYISSFSYNSKSLGPIYYVIPRKLTERENNGLTSFYWEKGRYESELYKTEVEALMAIKKKGNII